MARKEQTSSKAVKLPSSEAIRESTLRLLAAEGPEKSIGPGEVARDLMGTDEKVWRLGMRSVGQAAVLMAVEGIIVITRKGKPVPPTEVRGLYRIRLRGKDEIVEYPAKVEKATDPDFDEDDFDFLDDDDE